MANISINKAPEGYAVIPFFITAAIFFFAFSLLFQQTGSQILGHYFQPRVLAIVHTLVLGWGTMIILGAAYQLIPVIFERELKTPSLAFASYISLTIGTCLLIHSFWSFQIGWMMILGGSFVCISSYLYFIILWRTLRDSEQVFELHLFFMLSAFWFCFTCSIGLLLAINLAYPFIEKSHLDILKLHAHAGIAGWFLQLVFGAAAKMLPMFLLGKSNKRNYLYASVILINIGLLLFLWKGYKDQVDLYSLLFGGIVFAGFICWGLYILDCFRHRARKKIDIPMRHAFISILCLLLAFATLPLVLQNSSGQWVTLYAIWIFLGWITSIILGMTFKTLPFIIWNLRYKGMNGMANLPMPKDLYSQRLLNVQYYVFLLSLLATTLAVGLKLRWAINACTYLWIILAASYLINVFKVLLHKRKDQHEN